MIYPSPHRENCYVYLLSHCWYAKLPVLYSLREEELPSGLCYSSTRNHTADFITVSLGKNTDALYNSLFIKHYFGTLEVTIGQQLPDGVGRSEGRVVWWKW